MSVSVTFIKESNSSKSYKRGDPTSPEGAKALIVSFELPYVPSVMYFLVSRRLVWLVIRLASVSRSLRDCALGVF